MAEAIGGVSRGLSRHRETLIVLLDAYLSEAAGTDFFASGDDAVSSYQWSAAAGEH
ncbi:hypothetical protein [Ensifer sp. Root142]|uniref:hypothetical protein n=1 Tax=Ensifer sp. Root142 TaxID=1736461 RepID=UPI000A8AC8EA|nr:hypothetical protein [Ensifer sp. Root142]MDP9629366.1 hypothetical protein [Ensifer adhaerens]